ncbi:hypothetical protein [Chryseobacterium koreense]
MSKVSINIIKDWFKNQMKPPQEQFWAWLDSFWHKDEAIPQSAVEELENTLKKKADLVNGVVPEEQLPFSVQTSEILAIGEITATSDQVTLAVHSSGKNKVRIKGKIYERSFPNNWSFSPVISHTKILILYALADPAIFFMAEGLEAVEAVEPELPEGALVIRRIVVNVDGSIHDENSGGFKLVGEDNWRTIELNSAAVKIISMGITPASSFDVIPRGEGTKIGGIGAKVALFLWDGKEFWFRNSTNYDVTCEPTAIENTVNFKGVTFLESYVLKSKSWAKFKIKNGVLILVEFGGSANFPDGAVNGQVLEADDTVPGGVKWGTKIKGVADKMLHYWDATGNWVSSGVEFIGNAWLRLKLIHFQGYTIAQKNAIASPVEGMLIYQNEAPKGFQNYENGAWTAVGSNISNADLSNVSVRTFTQGNAFTWNTAGFLYYLKGLIDKTGNAAYTKVVVVHPTTGETVTRDFADPAATTLAIQNSNSTQKMAMRTALLGVSTPASPVLNNALPAFIKIGEQTEIELIGLNLTLIDPTSIYIVNPVDSSKIFAQSYYNRTSLIVTTVWTIPNTVPEGIYDIKIDLGVVAQGLSTAKLKVVSAVTSYNLLASQFVAKTKNNDPIVKTYAVSDNYIQVSGDVTGVSYPTPLDIDGVVTVKSANILDGSKNWLIMADVMVPSYAAGTIEPLAPSFGVTQTTDVEFTSLTSIMTAISVSGNAQNIFHNGTLGFNVSGSGSGGTAFYNIILEKTGQDVVFKMKRTLPGGVIDIMTKTLTGLINTSKMYALFFHEGGSNSHRKITNYTFLKIYQS